MKVFDLMTGGDQEKVNQPSSSSNNNQNTSRLFPTNKMTLSEKLQVDSSEVCEQ
jgi:hypothetical protein